MALSLGQGRVASGLGWPPADQPEEELPLEASSHLVFETFSELSLADSPVKLAPPQAPALSHSLPPCDGSGGAGAPLPPPWAPHELSPHYLSARSQPVDLESPGSPRLLMASPDASLQLQHANLELSLLRQRVQELEEQVAAARKKERAGPSPAFAASLDQDLRDLQSRLRAREREVVAVQAALERGQAEAKGLAAQLEAERSTSSGLRDEVEQWRGEYTKAKKDLTALQKRLESLSAQNSLLDGSIATLKKQNAELGKVAAEKEAALRALHDKMHALQGHEGSRHKQVQELMNRLEVLHKENTALEQHCVELQDASAGAYNAREQMQRLWEEQEQLCSENASLRSELQRMADALVATRSQLWERTSRQGGGMAAGKAPMQPPISYTSSRGPAPATGQPIQLGGQGAAAGATWQELPGTAAQPEWWGQCQGASTQPGSYLLGSECQPTEGLDQPLVDRMPAEAGHRQQQQQQQQQQWASWQASMREVRPETAATHERYGEAAPAPATLCCPSFGAQADARPPLDGSSSRWGPAGQSVAPADAGLSPLGPDGFNLHASLPQPYLPPAHQRSQLPERAQSPQGSFGSRDALQAGPASADYSSWQIPAAPGPAGGFQERPRLSSSEEGSQGGMPGPKARPSTATAPPYGSEVTLQEMLARTQALESRLMKLSMEKNELEAEHARMPTHTPGRKLQDRRRKEEIAARLDVVTKEISNIRLQLKKLGYK